MHGEERRHAIGGPPACLRVPVVERHDEQSMSGQALANGDDPRMVLSDPGPMGEEYADRARRAGCDPDNRPRLIRDLHATSFAPCTSKCSTPRTNWPPAPPTC